MDVTVYHNKENSANQLLTFSIHLDPNKDGALMQITNQLIREGWELVYIKDSNLKDISTETHEFTFHRFIDVK